MCICLPPELPGIPWEHRTGAALCPGRAGGGIAPAGKAGQADSSKGMSTAAAKGFSSS